MAASNKDQIDETTREGETDPRRERRPGSSGPEQANTCGAQAK